MKADLFLLPSGRLFYGLGVSLRLPSLRSSLPLRCACGPLPFTWPRAATGPAGRHQARLHGPGGPPDAGVFMGVPVAGRGLMSGCHGAKRNDWTKRAARRVRGTLSAISAKVRAFWLCDPSFARVSGESVLIPAPQPLIRARFWQKCARKLPGRTNPRTFPAKVRASEHGMRRFGSVCVKNAPGADVRKGITCGKGLSAR